MKTINSGKQKTPPLPQKADDKLKARSPDGEDGLAGELELWEVMEKSMRCVLCGGGVRRANDGLRFQRLF